MKLKLTLLLLVAALLIVPIATHAEPLPSTAPVACAANASTAQLPGLSTPASNALLEAIVGRKCGSCSGTICVGAIVGSRCGIAGGQFEFCADGGDCPADGLTHCVCKTGPPF
jgi:hypothetical protein